MRHRIFAKIASLCVSVSGYPFGKKLFGEPNMICSDLLVQTGAQGCSTSSCPQFHPQSDRHLHLRRDKLKRRGWKDRDGVGVMVWVIFIGSYRLWGEGSDGGGLNGRGWWGAVVVKVDLWWWWW